MTTRILSVLARPSLAVLAAVAIAAVSLLVAGRASAAPDDVDFSIEVAGAGCSTATVDTKCDVAPGGPYTLRVNIDAFSTFKGGYSSGKVSLVRSITGTPKASSIIWPGCGSPGLTTGASSAVLGCTPGNSSYLGSVLELQYNCPSGTSSHTITLLNAADGSESHVVSTKGPTAVDVDGKETLTINCTEEAPALVGGVQADLSDRMPSHDGGPGAIAAASAAGVIALAGIGWGVRRRTGAS